MNKTKSGAKVADALKELEVEGGLAGKWRVLYEVSQQHKQAHQTSDLLLAWTGCMGANVTVLFLATLWCPQCQVMALPGQASVRLEVVLLHCM